MFERAEPAEGNEYLTNAFETQDNILKAVISMLINS